MRFTATVRREDDWFVAQALEIDVASQGRTIEESLTNLVEAITLFLDESEPVVISSEPTFVTTIDVPARAAG